MSRHSARAQLPYPAASLFDLVADVARFPEFLPWVRAVAVRECSPARMAVDMVVGDGPLSRRFSSTAHLERPFRIDIESHDPLFSRFDQHWRFTPAGACTTDVEFEIDLAFRSRVAELLVEARIRRRTADVLDAFKRRARQILGPVHQVTGVM